jgi:hypothetical protein
MHIFLALALVGDELSASFHGCFMPGAGAYGVCCTGGWVGSRTSLKIVETRNIFPLRDLNCGTAHSQLLC